MKTWLGMVIEIEGVGFEMQVLSVYLLPSAQCDSEEEKIG
jgi:hypothetical protein